MPETGEADIESRLGTRWGNTQTAVVVLEALAEAWSDPGLAPLSRLFSCHTTLYSLHSNHSDHLSVL